MSSQPFAPDARIGKYEILGHVATGGMGAVYKAVDSSLGRVVALKVLAGRLLENPAALVRFRREARNAASLNHPNIVTLYEWDKVGDSYYLAMEFVDGPDLDAYISKQPQGRLEPAEARDILIQAVRALHHAYRQGIVHRDVKPSNFLLDRQHGDLVVKMTDLGLSRTASDDEYRVTRDGSTVGTVDYLSPEQSRDSSLADIRSDIYSLGCTAYHMLTGHPPFPDGGLGERVYKHLNVEPEDIRRLNPAVPAGLWAVLKRMLAKDPDDRHQTPAALLKDLLHLPAGTPEEPAQKPKAAPSPRRVAPREESVAPPPVERQSDSSAVLDGEPDPGLTTPEQRQAAAQQYRRAVQLAGGGENDDYARHLLLSCCKLDPASLRYRQALRQLRPKRIALLGRLTAPLGKLAGKARLQSALRQGVSEGAGIRRGSARRRPGRRRHPPGDVGRGRGARAAEAGLLAGRAGAGPAAGQHGGHARPGTDAGAAGAIRPGPAHVGARPAEGPPRPRRGAQNERSGRPGNDRARRLPESAASAPKKRGKPPTDHGE